MSYLKRQITKLELINTILISLICVFAFFLGSKFSNEKNIWIKLLVGAAIGSFASIIIIIRDWVIIKQEKYKKGLRGEEFLQTKLKQLPGSLRFISNIKLDYGNVDFLIIGDQGIFCIENKNTGGRITYDSINKTLLHNYHTIEKDYIKQVKRNSVQLFEKIKNKLGKEIYVQPILVFSGLGVTLEIPEQIDDVFVIESSKLMQFFQSHYQNKITSNDQDLIFNLFNKQ